MATRIWFIGLMTICILFFAVAGEAGASLHLPKDLKPCLPYLERNSTSVGPSVDCCRAVENRKCDWCICRMVRRAAKYKPTLDPKRLLNITEVCSVTDGPINCQEAPNPAPKLPPPIVTVPPPADGPLPPANAPPQADAPPQANATTVSGAAELFVGSFTIVTSSLVAAVFF